MDNKIIALIAVAVVVVAGGAAAFLMLPGDGGKDDKNHYDDFKMLEDTKNFDKGFYYMLDCQYDGKTQESFEVTVDKKDGDTLNYTLTYKNFDTKELNRTNFFSYFQFSLDDPSNIPAGIIVNKDGNTYTVNGTSGDYLVEYFGFTCKAEFDNVVLTLDGQNYISGSGSAKIISENSEKAGNLNITYSFSTKDGKCLADVVHVESEPSICSPENLFDVPITPHYAYLKDYKSYSPVKTGETKKVGNVDCDVFTYSVTDETYSICVYYGIVLQKDRTSDGKYVESLHVDKK